MRCTLITGASGLVGGDWLRRLLAKQDDRRFVVLTRHPEMFARVARVAAVGCDLARGEILLSDQWLSSITEIIHCAADIRFGIPLDQARAVNVEGTRRVLEIARRCARLEKLAHVSSVYAAGKLAGDFPEEAFPANGGFFNVYQQSKYEAEELVLRSMRAIPAAIFRLSSIIGDSRGQVRQFNYFHQLLKMIPNSGPVPVMPGDPLAPVDLMPSDWAVASLAYLFERRFEAGRIYHVCAGPAASVAAGKLVNMTFAHFGMRPPRLVGMADFERFAVERRDEQAGVVGEMLRVLDQFLPHLALRQSFDNARTREDLDSAGLGIPALESYYTKILDYCVRTNWGRARGSAEAVTLSMNPAG